MPSEADKRFIRHILEVENGGRASLPPATPPETQASTETAAKDSSTGSNSGRAVMDGWKHLSGQLDSLNESRGK
jgi:hypothetical protein